MGYSVGVDGGNDSIALVLAGGGVSLRDVIMLDDSLLRPGELNLSSSLGGSPGGVDGGNDSNDSIMLVDAQEGGAPHATPSFLMSPLFSRGELMSSSSPGGSTGGVER